MLQSRNETYLPLTNCPGIYPAIDGRAKISKAPYGEKRIRPHVGYNKLQRQRWRFGEELFD
jgi:hypothetical protein